MNPLSEEICNAWARTSDRREFNCGSLIIYLHDDLVIGLLGVIGYHTQLQASTPPRSHQGDLKGCSNDLSHLGRFSMRFSEIPLISQLFSFIFPFISLYFLNIR